MTAFGDGLEYEGIEMMMKSTSYLHKDDRVVDSNYGGVRYEMKNNSRLIVEIRPKVVRARNPE